MNIVWQVHKGDDKFRFKQKQRDHILFIKHSETVVVIALLYS